MKATIELRRERKKRRETELMLAVIPVLQAMITDVLGDHPQV
jgi:hypothetical protein